MSALGQSVLSRLKQETERLKNQGSRKVFVSSRAVQAFRVAHEKKDLLTKEYPLILAVDESPSSSTSLSLIDASVGPDLKWSLSSINHVLRTVSKYNEPTYIFANILDNDPQAFVAVTLSKSTPDDELEHLESVLGRVSQLHIAEKKPMQVPDAGDVMNALGKGLMGLLGISSGSKQREMREKERERVLQQQQEREEQERRDAAQRAAYGTGMGGERVRVTVHGRQVPDELDDVPTAPMMYTPADSHRPGTLRSEDQAGWPARGGGHAQPMGVTDKKAAESRLEALKAELAKEGAPPTAPDLHAKPEDSTRSGIYSTGPAPTAPTYSTHDQQQQQRRDYQRPAPGVLSNPFPTSHERDSEPGRQYGSSRREEYYSSGRDSGPGYDSARTGPDGHTYRNYPSIPTLDKEDTDYYGTTAPRTDRGSYDSRGTYRYSDAPGGDHAYDVKYDTKPWGEPTSAAGTEKLSEREMLELQREAQSARAEWERTQREVQQREQQAQRDAALHDAGWGPGRDQGSKQQNQQQKKSPPDWLDTLGKVFGGGPAYTTYAPDL